MKRQIGGGVFWKYKEPSEASYKPFRANILSKKLVSLHFFGISIHFILGSATRI